MQLLKKTFICGLIVLSLSFGFTVSAVPTDDFDILQWVKASAEKDDPIAQAGLAARYHKGIGVRQNYEKSFYWNQQAANNEHAGSQYSLGSAYMKGKGVQQDYNKALYWFKKASDQEHSAAQFSLGMMYYEGKGVRQDHTIAKEWYGKSCDNGTQYGCDLYRILNERGY